MGIETNICRLRRSLQREDGALFKAKQVLTSDRAKSIYKLLFAVGGAAATAAAAHSHGYQNGYDQGFSDGWDGGFEVGDFAGRMFD